MSASLICTRAIEFGCRMIQLSEKLWDRGPAARRIASEDFIAKLAISRKESRESGYWLRMAIRLKKVTNEEVAWKLNEAGELRAMIVAAIKTAQSSASRGDIRPGR